MNRNELVREFRIATQDLVAPYLWDTADVVRWLEEAEREACVRGRLLHESIDLDMCEIAVAPEEAVYPLHPRLYEIDHIAFLDDGASCRRPIKLVSSEYLDATVQDWRDRVGRVEYAIQGETSLRLVPRPDAPGTVLLEGYRLPNSPAGATSFEIHEAQHRNLLDWALFRAFSVPDAETLDLGRAAEAERAFTAYFGVRPGSDLRRQTREDVPQANVGYY
ncbi:phage adaptor protein [Stutzerimonas nitrititolerans]|uniref:phage adaptor protein n=1 Tax=Stutzerimonas nitrititolerans TaxID=2482751 RepID=UPI0028A12BDE|nr:DUF6682 family protein [Stutzerimonas nitrititolerans]